MNDKPQKAVKEKEEVILYFEEAEKIADDVWDWLEGFEKDKKGVLKNENTKMVKPA